MSTAIEDSKLSDETSIVASFGRIDGRLFADMALSEFKMAYATTLAAVVEDDVERLIVDVLCTSSSPEKTSTSYNATAVKLALCVVHRKLQQLTVGVCDLD